MLSTVWRRPSTLNFVIATIIFMEGIMQEKSEIIAKFKQSENDTGSVQVQVALLRLYTIRISFSF